MHYTKMPDDIKEDLQFAFKKIQEDRQRYFDWIKNEIEVVISLINRYDKVLVLGGLGAKLIKATPTLQNQLIGTFEHPNKQHDKKEKETHDDEIEVILEYAMNIATATSNKNIGVTPKQKNIDDIIDQLKRIKSNINLFEISTEIPPSNEIHSDNWLRTMTIQNSINIRGDGYQNHIELIYKEIFSPHDEFLYQFYGFNSEDILNTISGLDFLVCSKIANDLGGVLSHKRYVEWVNEVGEEEICSEMSNTGKNFIDIFLNANQDLYDAECPGKVILHSLDNIESVGKIFRVIPKTKREKKIYEMLSIEFGDNAQFYEPKKFKAFPLNDSIININPIIKQGDYYYCFSLALAHRNLFKITEFLIERADAVYFQNTFRGNAAAISKDNYIEQKTKEVFESLLPNVHFYHSLKYKITENGIEKQTELDLIGIGKKTAFIIEVKAGQLTTKHRRGALKGLKKRLKEIINKGSYQCHRALKYIKEAKNPSFKYNFGGRSKILKIKKLEIKKFIKISVTFEHFSAISLNLKELIESEILHPDYKWTWIVSLFDLMIFSDLIENEQEFIDYIDNRIKLYDRTDYEFMDEVDILGFFLDGGFPLGAMKIDEKIMVSGYSSEIDEYYTKVNFGISDIVKPKKK